MTPAPSCTTSLIRAHGTELYDFLDDGVGGDGLDYL